MAAIAPIEISLTHMRAPGHSPVPATTPLFVLRTDLKTATTDPDDPTGLAIDLAASSPAGNSALHRVVKNPSAYFLDLFEIISGTVFTVSQKAKVRVFGFVPFSSDKGNTNNPYGFDTTNFTSPDHASLLLPVLKKVELETVGGLRGLWLPCRRPTDGAHELEFSDSFEVDKDATTGSSKQHKLTDNAPDADANPLSASVYVGGCTHVLATVSQALAGPTTGMLLGMFRS